MEKTQSDSFLTSLLYIRERIKERKQPFSVSIDISPRQRDKIKEFEELSNDKNQDFKKIDKKSIKNNSPFSNYFNKLISNLSMLLQQNTRAKENPFYKPDIFQLIQKQLYLAPVWSGFFLNAHFEQKREYYMSSYYEKKMPTKLENNRVENHFVNLKNGILILSLFFLLLLFFLFVILCSGMSDFLFGARI